MRVNRLCITKECDDNLAVGLCITLCIVWIDMRICRRGHAYTMQCIYSQTMQNCVKNDREWGKQTEISAFFAEYDVNTDLCAGCARA